MNQLEWQRKSCEVFVSGIPFNSPLSESDLRREVRNVLREWGELSHVRLLPPSRTARSRCAISGFVWNGNAIECIKPGI